MSAKKNPPWTRGGHVFLQNVPCHSVKAVFVCAKHNFEGTRC